MLVIKARVYVIACEIRLLYSALIDDILESSGVPLKFVNWESFAKLNYFYFCPLKEQIFAAVPKRM